MNDYGTEMETGFLIDQQGRGVDWHRGVPNPETVFGFETTAYKIDRTQILETRTFRCTRCGLLKSYLLTRTLGSKPMPQQTKQFCQ